MKIKHQEDDLIMEVQIEEAEHRAELHQEYENYMQREYGFLLDEKAELEADRDDPDSRNRLRIVNSELQKF